MMKEKLVGDKVSTFVVAHTGGESRVLYVWNCNITSEATQIVVY